LPLLHLTILLPPQSVDVTMIVQVFAIIPRWESWVPSFLSNFADCGLSVCRLIVQVLSGEKEERDTVWKFISTPSLSISRALSSSTKPWIRTYTLNMKTQT